MDSELKLFDKAGNLFNVRGTKKGTLSMSKRIPDYATLVNEGRVWKAQDGTTTAVNNGALPTTTAGLTIQNPTRDTSYLVLAVTAIANVSPAAVTTWGLILCVHQLAVASLYTRDVSMAVTGASVGGGMKAGQGAYTGQIILDRGATVVDDGWVPIGPQVCNEIASGDWSQLYFALPVPVIIAPGHHISFGAVGESATTEVGIGLVWAEIGEDELG